MKKIVLAVIGSLFALAANADSLRDRYDNERHLALAAGEPSAYVQENAKWKAKDGYKPSLAICQTQSTQCLGNQAEIIASAKFAYKGDYQAQRNIAFCLFTGCQGAVIVDKALACAWRTVILAAATSEVDATDTSNLQACKNDLTPTENAAAVSRAGTLFKSVYGKPIGRQWR
ncbi:hypothetical protein At1D1108_34370 [Agrobacterium tumefaciens]|nr:hypothetical protein At1D1108_34370 [Agrobacterium tumefaciens]